MSQMTPKQTRVIDPVLTEHARKYKNADFVLGKIFPDVPVLSRSGNVIEFNKDSFRQYNTRRAPGANTKRIQVGYAGDPIALKQDALEGLVPNELRNEAGQVSIDMTTAAVSSVMDVLMLGTEIERGKLATNASSYAADNKAALTGADKWSDSTSKPKEHVDTGREQVRKRTGHKANIAVISPAAELALTHNNSVRDQFKYTSGDSITREMLARYFQVDEVIVPEAVSLPEGAPENADFEDVWGDFVLLAYVPKSVRGIHVPSFGYTYKLNGYPMVEESYDDRSAKSSVHPVTLEERAYLTSADAGYLISGVTS